MASTKRRYGKEEFARRGNAIYQAKIAPLLKDKDKDKFLAIDIETGEYEIAGSELAAADRLRARIPQAQIWLVKAGSPYLYRIGILSPRGR